MMRDILIVEDGLHERERLSRLFSSAHFSVECAESVEEAERILEIENFRLAILDVGLGDKSGTHLFEKLRRNDSASFIIILTGNSSVHLKQRFLDAGVNAYIQKASSSASNESLLETVISLLGDVRIKAKTGIPLVDFIKHYVDESSRRLFLDENNELPACNHCGQKSYLVTFCHRTQIPPIVEGRVVCESCGEEMDPEVV